MTKKYKILSNYIKDLSSETPNIETYLFVKDKIGCLELISLLPGAYPVSSPSESSTSSMSHFGFNLSEKQMVKEY